jgi:hypothetical protein
VSVTPGSGTGASGTFVLLYSDTAGVADLSSAKVRFAPTSASGPGNGINTCTASYDPAGNSLSLMNDSGSAWVAGPLGSGSVSNSQCTIDLASSSVSSSGNNLTLTLAIRFTPAFAGDKNTYLRATTDGGANTDWQARGTWTVPAGVAGTPSVVSVSPNSGGGRSANFVLRYSDTAGATDLATARVRFVNYNVGGAGTGANSCTASYNRSAGTVSLQNNTATGWITGTLGSGTISNSQCTINLAMSTASASGNNLTLTLAITFTQSFNGAKRTYMLGNTNGGTSTGWIQRGVWMVQN